MVKCSNACINLRKGREERILTIFEDILAEIFFSKTDKRYQNTDLRSSKNPN